MKHINFTLATLLLVFCSSLFAQVRQEVTAMPVGAKNAYILTLPKCSVKIAESQWKDFLKQYKASASKMKKKEEFFTDNTLIPGISSGNNPVDLYARFDESGEDVRAILWVDLGGAFVNSADFAAQSEQAEQLLLRYGIAVAKYQVGEELEGEEKKFKGLEGDLKKLVKNNEDSKKDIEEYKAKIKKAEEAIVANDKEQVTMRQMIEKQRNILEAVKAKLAKLQ